MLEKTSVINDKTGPVLEGGTQFLSYADLLLDEVIKRSPDAALLSTLKTGKMTALQFAFEVGKEYHKGILPEQAILNAVVSLSKEKAEDFLLSTAIGAMGTPVAWCSLVGETLRCLDVPQHLQEAEVHFTNRSFACLHEEGEGFSDALERQTMLAAGRVISEALIKFSDACDATKAGIWQGVKELGRVKYPDLEEDFYDLRPDSIAPKETSTSDNASPASSTTSTPTDSRKAPVSHGVAPCYHPPAREPYHFNVSPSFQWTSDGFRTGIVLSDNRFGQYGVYYEDRRTEEFIQRYLINWTLNRSCLFHQNIHVCGEAITISAYPTGEGKGFSWEKCKDLVFGSKIKVVLEHKNSGIKKEIKVDLASRTLDNPKNVKILQNAISTVCDKFIVPFFHEKNELFRRELSVALEAKDWARAESLRSTFYEKYSGVFNLREETMQLMHYIKHAEITVADEARLIELQDQAAGSEFLPYIQRRLDDLRSEKAILAASEGKLDQARDLCASIVDKECREAFLESIAQYEAALKKQNYLTVLGKIKFFTQHGLYEKAIDECRLGLEKFSDDPNLLGLSLYAKANITACEADWRLAFSQLSRTTHPQLLTYLQYCYEQIIEVHQNSLAVLSEGLHPGVYRLLDDHIQLTTAVLQSHAQMLLVGKDADGVILSEEFLRVTQKKVREYAEQLKQHHRVRAVADIQNPVLALRGAHIVSDVLFDFVFPCMIDKEAKIKHRDTIASARQLVTQGFTLTEQWLKETISPITDVMVLETYTTEMQAPIKAALEAHPATQTATESFFAKYQMHYLIMRVLCAGVQCSLGLLKWNNTFFQNLKTALRRVTYVLDVYALLQSAYSVLSGATSICAVLRLASQIPLLNPWLLDEPNSTSPRAVSTHSVRLFFGYLLTGLNNNFFNRYAVSHGQTLLTILSRFLSSETGFATTLLKVGKHVIENIISPILLAYQVGSIFISLPTIITLRQVDNILLSKGIYINLEMIKPEQRKQMFFKTWINAVYSKGQLLLLPNHEKHAGKALAIYQAGYKDTCFSVSEEMFSCKRDFYCALEKSLKMTLVVLNKQLQVIYPQGDILDNHGLENPAIILYDEVSQCYVPVLLRGELYAEQLYSKSLHENIEHLSSVREEHKVHCVALQTEVKEIVRGMEEVESRHHLAMLSEASFWSRQQRRKTLCDEITVISQRLYQTLDKSTVETQCPSEDELAQTAVQLLEKNSLVREDLLAELTAWLDSTTANDDQLLATKRFA